METKDLLKNGISLGNGHNGQMINTDAIKEAIKNGKKLIACGLCILFGLSLSNPGLTEEKKGETKNTTSSASVNYSGNSFDIKDSITFAEKKEEFREELKTKFELVYDDTRIDTILNYINGNYDYFKQFSKEEIEIVMLNLVQSLVDIGNYNKDKTEDNYFRLSKFIGDENSSSLIHDSEDKVIKLNSNRDYEEYAYFLKDLESSPEYLSLSNDKKLIVLSILKPSSRDLEQNCPVIYLDKEKELPMYTVSLMEHIHAQFNELFMNSWGSVLQNCINESEKTK